VFALASLLLDYPDDDLCASRDRIGEAIASLPRSLASADLREFWAWFCTADPSQLRVEYVKTFDHRRRAALYATFAPYGDTRRRGVALAKLRDAYHRAGFVERDGELPDYLPVVLQFAALAGDDAADDVLCQARGGIESVTKALDAQKSPYAAVMRAVERCLPAPRQSIDPAGIGLEFGIANLESTVNHAFVSTAAGDGCDAESFAVDPRLEVPA